MEKDAINVLIENYKKGISQEECVEKLINRFYLLIHKYARKLYNYDFEDAYQEMILTLLESINKIDYFKNEGECVNYISNALRFRALELYRKDKIYRNNTIYLSDELDKAEDTYDKYKEAEFFIDLKRSEIIKSWLDRKIVNGIVYENLSDAQIAKKCKVSRQYINRRKKYIFKKLKMKIN